MLIKKEYRNVQTYLADATKQLEGCDVLIIASNTGHVAAEEIIRRYPKLPLLHIADATARAIRSNGFRKVGLLGTEPTMRERYLKDRLALHGIETIVPSEERDLKRIFEIIMHELSHGEIKRASREFFVKQIDELMARGAQGIILGCTEIELLVRPEDVRDVVLFPTAHLHISAAVCVQSGIHDVTDYTP